MAMNLVELANLIKSRLAQTNSELGQARYGFMPNANPQQKALFQQYYMSPVMGATTSPYISNQAAQIAARVGQKNDLTGNLSFQDVDDLMKVARKELLSGKKKMPLKAFSKMSVDNIIAELRSLISPEQSKYIGG